MVGASAVAGAGLVRAQDNRIVLGQSAAFSGPSMQLGTQFHAGAQLYFEQLAAKGGINGRMVEIRQLDDGYEPERCASNTEKLIRDDVFALFGYVGTPTSIAALPMASAARVPFFAPFTGAKTLREPFKREAFHLRASYDDETELIVNQLTNLHQNRIAVFYQNDAYGHAGLAGVTKALTARKLKSVAEATVERNSVDVAAAAAKLASSGAQAIVQIGSYKASAAFIREARKAGFGGSFYNVSFVGTQALADELGKEGAGVMVSQVMPSPYNPARPIAREFVAAAKQSGRVQPNFSSMEGYLAARVFAEGLRRASGKPTRESLITALESINEDFGGYRVGFSASNHVASRFAELSMLTGDGRVKT
jgi:ABC-type branched-subunit amino acid transport system substrate-binding protein